MSKKLSDMFKEFDSQKKEVQEEKKVSPDIKKSHPERMIVEKIPSRFLSGICAILGVKGYGNMSKDKLIDTLIMIFKNEREK